MKAITKIYFVNDNNEKFFGAGPCQLLHMIEETGSLRSASISMGLAYTKALRMINKAEKELGGGTGQIKLRYVYDMFVARFAWLARVISFEAFSMMVDEALERMKKMLESNKAMQTLVSGEAGEVNE